MTVANAQTVKDKAIEMLNKAGLLIIQLENKADLDAETSGTLEIDGRGYSVSGTEFEALRDALSTENDTAITANIAALDTLADEIITELAK